ncbi:MAG TPA: hypothetical protein DCM86_01875 [Verrucomicrobiales bacterium]|nr:hypothetical protein [Verrucomicrobiales bacterium]
MSNDANAAWARVVSDFRSVCLLKKEGQLEESSRILNEVLPSSIAAWSQHDPRDGGAKRQHLQAMFAAEQQRVDQAWEVEQRLLSRLSTTVFSEWKEQMQKELRAQLNEWLASEGRSLSSPDPVRTVAAPAAVVEPPPWRRDKPAAATPPTGVPDPAVVEASTLPANRPTSPTISWRF